MEHMVTGNRNRYVFWSLQNWIWYMRCWCHEQALVFYCLICGNRRQVRRVFRVAYSDNGSHISQCIGQSSHGCICSEQHSKRQKFGCRCDHNFQAQETVFVCCQRSESWKGWKLLGKTTGLHHPLGPFIFCIYQRLWRSCFTKWPDRRFAIHYRFEGSGFIFWRLWNGRFAEN